MLGLHPLPSHAMRTSLRCACHLISPSFVPPAALLDAEFFAPEDDEWKEKWNADLKEQVRHQLLCLLHLLASAASVPSAALAFDLGHYWCSRETSWHEHPG